jgi:hypothetical protein
MGAQGTATLDFGAFPGASDASVAVTGQTGILSGSLIEAWLVPADTTDHLADEHRVETLEVMAGSIIAGTGFTIYGTNTCEVNEPVAVPQGVGRQFSQDATQPDLGGKSSRIYGKWNVGWVWN